MKIVWTNTAIGDLDRTIDYIELDAGTQTALNVINEIKVQVERLARFPNLGRAGRVKTTRELVMSSLPYVAAYMIDENTLRILAVIHTSRKWPDGF